MEWIRGCQVGRGAFGTVNFAIPKSDSRSLFQHPPLMVVKSSDFSSSHSLRNEKEVLIRLGGECPEIVKCFGDSHTAENGRDLYNLFLEYAAGGSLADRLLASPENRLSEREARSHANSVLKGLAFIHGRGFAHCDVKLQNMLLFADGKVKISDFGLARGRKEAKRGGFELRGTPLYMAPEVVSSGGGDAPADVWALGCAVVEMVTGRPAWRCEPGCGIGALLCLIAAANAAPEIPECVSEDGRDFLSKCFVKDPNERWTARMLLDHPFVSGLGDDEKTTSFSPRGPFEFPDLTPTATADLSEEFCSPDYSSGSGSILNRVDTLAIDPISWPVWSEFDGWVTVRILKRVDF